MRRIGKDDLTGIFTALVTPFDADGRVDGRGLRRLIRRQIEAGISGVAVVAGSGEFVNLLPDERAEVVRIAVEEAGDDLIVVAGVLSPATHAAVRWSRRASDLGAAALLVLTPFYNSPSPDGVVRHFSEIAQRVDTPIILYNNPGRTNICLGLSEYETLAEETTVIGVKECNRELAAFSALAGGLGHRLAILSGEDDLLLPSLVLGAQGGILTTSNILPREWCDLFRAVHRNDIASARAMHRRLAPIISAVYTKNHPALVKAALDCLGLPAGRVRLPLMDPDPVKKAMLAELLAGFAAEAAA